MTITEINSFFLNSAKARPLLELSSRARRHFHQWGVDLISAARAAVPVCVCGTASVLYNEANYEGGYECKAHEKVLKFNIHIRLLKNKLHI